MEKSKETITKPQCLPTSRQKIGVYLILLLQTICDKPVVSMHRLWCPFPEMTGFPIWETGPSDSARQTLAVDRGQRGCGWALAVSTRRPRERLQLGLYRLSVFNLGFRVCMWWGVKCCALCLTFLLFQTEIPTPWPGESPVSLLRMSLH